MTREQRGFWDLLVNNVDGHVAHRFAQAVFLADTILPQDDASSYSLVKTGLGLFVFQGPAQEPGTELVFMGPKLRQRLPLSRLSYEPGYFRFELDAQDLSPGDWHLRLVQAGAFKQVPWLIRSDGGELSLVAVSQALREEGEQVSEPSGGCTCQSSQPLGWLVLLGLGLRLMRRRQGHLFNEAG